MKKFSVVFAVVFAVVSSSFAQQNWGWGDLFNAAFVEGGSVLTIEIPLSGWQRDDAPADNEDREMVNKRFPANAALEIWVYYSYYDKNGKTHDENVKISAKADWTRNVAIGKLDASFLPESASYTVVGKVPGYNKKEGNSIFVYNEIKERSFVGNSNQGKPEYHFAMNRTKRSIKAIE